MRINSKWRLTGLLGIILFLAFSSIIIIDYFSTRSSVKEEIVRSSLPLLQQNIYSKILSDLLPSMNTASMMANDSFLIAWAESGEKDVSKISAYLKKIRDTYGFDSVFFVSENTGRYYTPRGINKTISTRDSHDVWYYSFVESDKMFTLDVDTDQAAGDRLTIFINYRLLNHRGELLGVVGVGIEKDGFSEFLAGQQELFGKTIFLTDNAGVIQAHSFSTDLEQKDMHNLSGLDSIADEILSIRDGSYTGGYQIGGDGTVVMSRYIPEIDWYVIVEFNEHEAFADVRMRTVQSLIIGLLAFITVLLLSIFTIQQYDSQLEIMVSTDALTGLANRRALDAALPRMLYRRSRQGGDVSLILIDLDHFKSVNDSFGHQEGDVVLKSFSVAASSTIRKNDLLVRWGGDEFLIVTETGIEGAQRVAREIREQFGKVENRVTLSIGIALSGDSDDSQSLLKKADKALYDAKEGGRNRTVVFGASGVS